MAEYEVVVIEDDVDVQLGCIQALKLDGIKAIGVASAEKAGTLLTVKNFPGIIVTDIRLPGMSGMDYLRQIMAEDPDLPVIMITGHGNIETAVKAMRDGAYDFLQKPFSSQQLVSLVRRALDKRRLTLEIYQLRRRLASFSGLETRMIGHSQAMTELRELVKDMAITPADVMIRGETGTGKELLARSIHELSGRKGAFVALNCGGLSETLFDSEVFGHELGAFSGAARQRIGKIEYAQHGTLFLDEIESMPMGMQVKLLRVLQERVIERLGSNTLIPVDIRVISATKANLSLLCAEGKFRSDLHFRLNVVNIDLPPLREHLEDISLLFHFFADAACLRFDRPLPEINQGKIHSLMAYQWPGNVRELRNEAERFVLGLKNQLGADANLQVLPLTAAVESFERSLIAAELRNQQGNVTRTAETLQVAKSTLFDKIKKYAIELGPQ